MMKKLKLLNKLKLKNGYLKNYNQSFKYIKKTKNIIKAIDISKRMYINSA